MSLSQKALILIRLDARQGQDVSVADLAAHMDLAPPVVRQRIAELWDEGYVTPVMQHQGASDVSQIIAARLARPLPSCA